MLPAIIVLAEEVKTSTFCPPSDNGPHVHFLKPRTFYANLEQSQQEHQKIQTSALLAPPQTEPSPFAIESVRLGCKFTTARVVNVIHRN